MPLPSRAAFLTFNVHRLTIYPRTCSICQEDFEDPPVAPNIPARLDGCSHIFCYDCITNWLGSNCGGANKCPICRHKFFENTDLDTIASEWDAITYGPLAQRDSDQQRALSDLPRNSNRSPDRSAASSSSLDRFNDLRHALPARRRGWIADVTDDEDERFSPPHQSQGSSNHLEQDRNSGSGRGSYHPSHSRSSHNPSSSHQPSSSRRHPSSGQHSSSRRSTAVTVDTVQDRNTSYRLNRARLDYSLVSLFCPAAIRAINPRSSRHHPAGSS